MPKITTKRITAPLKLYMDNDVALRVVPENSNKTNAGSYENIWLDCNNELTTKEYCTINGSSGHKINCKHGCEIFVGDSCKIAAGDECIIFCSDCCTVLCGEDCRVSVGEYSRFKAGSGSEISFRLYDSSSKRNRTKTVYVGEDGIEPDTWYECKDKKIVRCNVAMVQ